MLLTHGQVASILWLDFILLTRYRLA
jgi:hypothetical protein